MLMLIADYAMLPPPCRYADDTLRHACRAMQDAFSARDIDA